MRIVNGETYLESNQTDPLIQRVLVPDMPTNNIVEITLTEQEFNTWHTFCRKITKYIESKLKIGQLTFSTKRSIKHLMNEISFQFRLVLETSEMFIILIQMR